MACKAFPRKHNFSELFPQHQHDTGKENLEEDAKALIFRTEIKRTSDTPEGQARRCLSPIQIYSFQWMLKYTEIYAYC